MCDLAYVVDTLQSDCCLSLSCYTRTQEQVVVELTRGGGRADGAVQGLQEVASQVVCAHHSLLEACLLSQLQSLVHIRTCVGTQPNLPSERQEFDIRTGAFG